MEKSGSKGYLIALIILVAILAGLWIFLSSPAMARIEGNKIAAECLRGSQSACIYFQAQENLAAKKLQLQEAKATLQTAKESYEASLERIEGE